MWGVHGTAVALVLLVLGQAGWAHGKHGHRASVTSEHCSYTLVVNEFDVSKCPTMQADASSPWTAGGAHWLPRPSAMRDSAAQQPPLGVRVTGEGGAAPRDAELDQAAGQEVDVLRSQVRDLETRLLDEMIKRWGRFLHRHTFPH